MTFKPNKSVTKRFKITKNKKVLFRPMHQDHFNAKYPGDKIRQRRGRKILKGALKKDIIKLS